MSLSERNVFQTKGTASVEASSQKHAWHNQGVAKNLSNGLSMALRSTCHLLINVLETCVCCVVTAGTLRAGAH